MSKIYMNGKLVEKADAVISVYDHGFLYGDGIFEGIRIYNSVVFKLHEHVVRLYESAKSIDLTIPLLASPADLAVDLSLSSSASKLSYRGSISAILIYAVNWYDKYIYQLFMELKHECINWKSVNQTF